MKTVARFIFITLAALMPLTAFSQSHIRAAAEKVRSITNPRVPMTNVVRRNPRTNAVKLTVVEAANLPASITKELVKAMDKDERNSFESEKKVTGGYCTRLMKFADKKSVLSVMITYLPGNYTRGSVLIREDFYDAAGRHIALEPWEWTGDMSLVMFDI